MAYNGSFLIQNLIAEAKETALESAINDLNQAIANLKAVITEVENHTGNSGVTTDQLKTAKTKLEEAKVTEIEGEIKVLENKDTISEEDKNRIEGLINALEEGETERPNLESQLELVVARKNLEEKIKEAGDVEIVEVSTDGSNIDPSENWTTAGEKKAFEDAITAAKEVLNKQDATKEEVEKAVGALDTAIETYKDAKKFGTKVVDKSKLEAKIKEAEESKVATSTEDGSDIEPSKDWTTQEALDDFEAAIDDAKEVLNKQDATEEEVNGAVDALESAIETYKDAKKAGTKEEVVGDRIKTNYREVDNSYILSIEGKNFTEASINLSVSFKIGETLLSNNEIDISNDTTNDAIAIAIFSQTISSENLEGPVTKAGFNISRSGNQIIFERAGNVEDTPIIEFDGKELDLIEESAEDKLEKIAENLQEIEIEVEDKSTAFKEDGKSGVKDVAEEDAIAAIKTAINNDEVEVSIDDFNSKEKEQKINISMGETTKELTISLILVPSKDGVKEIEISGDVKLMVYEGGKNTKYTLDGLKAHTDENIKALAEKIMIDENKLSIDSEFKLNKDQWKDLKQTSNEKLRAYRITILDDRGKIAKIAMYEDGSVVIEE